MNDERLKLIAVKATRARAALDDVSEAVVVVRGGDDDLKAFNSALADLKTDLDEILALCPLDIKRRRTAT